MGWAVKHLSPSEREEIARGCVCVEFVDGTELKALCPFHADSDPSFGYDYEKDTYHCFGCGASGDLIRLWGHVHGYEDDKAAFKEFQSAFGNNPAPSPPRPSRPLSSKESSPRIGPFLEESVWEQMQPLPEEWVVQLMRERGWTREAMQRLDLREESVAWSKARQKIEPVARPYRIAIPVRDRQGRLINVRRYRRPGVNCKIKIMSWGKPGHGAARLWPHPSTLDKGVVFLCEGEPDTICAISHGLQAITQTSKTKAANWNPTDLESFKDRDVVICYDKDQAGDQHSRAAAEALATHAKRVRVLRWPDFMGEKQDLTDFLVTHGRTVKDLMDLVAAAPTVEPPQADLLVNGPIRFFIPNERGGMTFKSMLLARHILETCPLLFDPETGILYRWTGKYWARWHFAQVERLAAQCLDIEVNNSRLTDTLRVVRAQSTIPGGREVNDRAEWISVENGMFNIETGEMRFEHDPDAYCTYMLPVTVDPANTPQPEHWLRYLESSVQTPEVIDQMQEFAGYCLTRDTRYAKCLFLHGPGEDGKSIFPKILQAMVGAENTSAVSFSDLEDQFLRAAIYNKVLNVGTEISSEAVESSMFKAIVTGDPVQAAFKHRDPFQFRPFVKMLFCGNKMPRVLDNSHGFFRRVLVVEYKRQFLEGDPDRDVGLEDKCMNELSGIFLWALEGLRRLREQGRFTNCPESVEVLSEWRRSNNPVQAFLEDNCEIGSGSVCKKRLWTAYRDYCREHGYKPRSHDNFFQAVYETAPGTKPYRPRVNGKRPQHVANMTLIVENSDV